MKKNILYIALLGMMSLMTVSCSSELDIEKHGNMGSMDTYYTTDENINSASASLYLSVRSNYFTWYFLKNLLSDDVWCGGGQRGDNGEMEKLNEYNFDTNHGSIEGVYSGLYTVIYNANLIIDMTQGDTPVMKRAINEAKVFRAWAHFELVSLWGTAPKVDHLLKPDEYRQANSDPAETWAFVEQDLTEAINSGTLPSKTSANDQETGIRVTKEFAQALLGKAYLFQGKYSEAASMLDNVINSGKYELFKGEYDGLFRAANNNNCESMFELQKRYDTEQMWNQLDMTFLMQGWRSDKLKYKGEAAQVIATGTYGFLNPRKSLYDAFVAWEGADGYRLKKSIWTYQQLNDFGVSISGSNAVYGNEGYFYWKGQSLKEDVVTDMSFFQGGQFIDLKIMRYAEVLLMAAEAQLQAGNNSKALDYINQIRTRAQEQPLTTVSLDDIKTEKRLELCLECVRYQDLVRWGDAKSAMGNQGKEVPAFTTDGIQWNWQNTVYGFQDKNMLLPIPLKELELNPNMHQNTGW
ncbi:MAG: RagB/SusD family nutrient uptake outer membrane protein [Prevotella sp.]|nr:RagB/SusD family nutrient uptake outer membrane protein [Prevotella sp.]